jgi:hypothetical protein
MLTQDRLKSQINYDPSTGVFTWIAKRKGVKTGSECGRISKGHHYREISIDNTLYRAHRLAFLYMDGILPTQDIDHVNRIKHDNSWNNLRLCNKSQNSANTGLKISNTSGYKGVVWDKNRNKWRVQIRIKGKKTNLGRFDDLNEAILISEKALKKEFGEFNLC